MSIIRALGALATIALVAPLSTGVAQADAALGGATSCKVSGRGVLWTFQGQTGVAYRVVGVNGASCPLAVTWLPRLTKQKGPRVTGPPGWTCAAHRPAGACTGKGGAVFTWSPKLRAR